MMRTWSKEEEYKQMLELGNITVSRWVSGYWGSQWLEDQKGPDWKDQYKEPMLAAKMRFKKVWDRDFAPQLKKAALVPSEEAYSLCPERFRREYFDHSMAHAVVEVSGARYLIQLYCDSAEVLRMWLVPRRWRG